MKSRVEMSELDRRTRVPHDKEWEAFLTFYSLAPKEEIDRVPSMLGGGGDYSVLENFSIEETTPQDFESLQTEDAYHHDDFHQYTGNDCILAPSLYYFHHCLLESGDPEQQAQVMNVLPVDYNPDVASLPAPPLKKRKQSPSDEYKTGFLASKNKLADSIFSMSQERKRENDRNDRI